MTQEELQALVLLLNRVPMTLPERLWVSTLLGKLAPAPETEPSGDDEETGATGE